MLFRNGFVTISYAYFLLWFLEFPVLSSEETPGSMNRILETEQIEAFEKDGFIVLKDVLSMDLIERLSTAGSGVAELGQRFPPYFSVVERGVFFDSGVGGPRSDETRAFREVALYSSIPQIAAELMQLDPLRQNLRVLRDILLSKGIDDVACDWHVDDQGFWPESFISYASKTSGVDQDGVNVWIALDDMPMEYAGSMALSAGSHKVPWRFEAYAAMGQNRTVDGGRSKEAILAGIEEQRRSGEVSLGACHIGVSRPDLREKLEAKKVVLDVRKGDIVFSTRTLFHRTTDVTDAGKMHYKSMGKHTLNRYSIRYTPGTARLPDGWLAEWSAATNSRHSGSSLDAIVSADGMLWYPKVWPRLENRLEAQLDILAEQMLESAKTMVQAEIIEMFAPKIAKAQES